MVMFPVLIVINYHYNRVNTQQISVFKVTAYTPVKPFIIVMLLRHFCVLQSGILLKWLIKLCLSLFATLKIPLSPLNAAGVVALVENGNSVCQVAEITDFSHSSINRAVPFLLAVSYDKRPRSDRCRVISAWDGKYLFQLVYRIILQLLLKWAMNFRGCKEWMLVHES